MKRLIILGAVWALVVARPELYKEKEDFQYSRSSSDDGSKSGFYGAQRGNMGGNFERAHNMDSLAQNQMSGLVKQVEGDLGDGAKTRAGNVYTAGSSRGTYGSGHFDLSNLEGRNFQEGSFFDDSNSQSSLSSSSAYNAAGYTNSHSQNSRRGGYQAAGLSGVNMHSDDLQSLDNLQGANQYGYGRQSSHSAGYNRESGFQQHNAYDSSNANALYNGYGSNAQTRLISATPVRIIVRPGTRVAIPVAAQTYDIAQGSSLVDRNSLNSDAEVLSTDNRRTLYRPSNAKHYESSYNYRKEWEKHDTVPSTVILPTTPTENPFPKNSELYEDSQVRTTGSQYDTSSLDSQRAHASKTYGGYNVKSASSQSQSNYDAHHLGASLQSGTNAYGFAANNAGSNRNVASSDSDLNENIQYNAGSKYHTAAADSKSLTQAGYNTGFNGDLNSQVENLNTKPKSYQSSYSYHKSWERQGDPYVIKPASSGYYDGQALTTGSTKNQAYAMSGSHYQHSHQSGADCDENGHIRVARSYNTDQFQDTQQQSQNLEDFGQQVQDLSQQSQNQWGQQEVGQQAQSTWDNLEDLNQQSQNQWGDVHKKWDQFEELGQTAEINWDQKNIGQQTNSQLENLDVDQKYQNARVDAQEAQNKQEQGHYQNRESQHDLNDSNILKHKDNKNDLQNQGIWQHPYNLRRTSEKPSQFDSFGDESFWQQLTRNTEQTHKVSDTNKQSNNKYPYSGFSNSQYYNNQHFFPQHENSFQPNRLYDNGNIYTSSHKQENTNRFIDSQINTFQRPVDTAPVLSLWSKLDNIEKQLISSANKNTDERNNLSLDNNTQIASQNSNQERTDDSHSFIHNYSQIKPDNDFHYHHQTVRERPQDVGRGDIGPELEDETLETSEIDKSIQNYNTENKLHVTEKNWQVPKQNESNVSNTININSQHLKNTGLIHSTTEQQHSEHFGHQENLEQNSQDFGEHQKLEQQNLQDFGEQENLEQHNLEQFGAQVNEQQNLQDFGEHQKLEQQNLQDFGQQENLEQHNLEQFGAQVNEQQSLQDFGEHQKLEQQNLQDFGQQENLEQHNLEQFGPQVNEQQNLQDFGEHQKLEQQNLQDFGQQENLEQHNLEQFGAQVNEQQNLQDFGERQKLEQHNLQDFGQQEKLEQHNLELFGPQVNVEQQNLQDFGEHQKLEQQNLQDFGQQVNLEQQNLQQFGPQVNVEQQNLQDFGEHQKLEQQNLQDFVQQENLEQHNLEQFGPQVNEQQNFQDFGEHQKLENFHNLEQKPNVEQHLEQFGRQEHQDQPILQDFGEHQKPKQQNFEDFGEQANLEQQNLEQFEQQENVEQQNLQDFGQHENLEHVGQQKNLENFEQQGILEEQNKFDPRNLEKLSSDSQQNFKYSDQLKQESHLNTYNKPQINLPTPEEVEEPLQVQKQKNELQTIPAQSQNTEETLTEKPGFWKSVGSKFSTAKSKISSWFQG